MPDLSIVIPSVNGFEDLEGCLRAIEDQRKDADVEAVVVDRLGEPLRSRVRESFPWARVVDVERTMSIPEMRRIGFSAATAPVIGVIEDHVIVRRGWAREVLETIAEGADVVGGPIENAATDTVMDWAAFLCEYSHCLPPLPAGEVVELPGNNIAYTRRILDAHASVIAEHKWENRLHEAIREGGTPLICRPGLIVDHKKHFTLLEYLSLRYQYSRSYAGARIEGASPVKRAAFAIGTLVLPPVLFYRTVSQIHSRRRHTRHLLRSLPYLAVFVSVWAWGELVGYVAGAGNSLSKVT